MENAGVGAVSAIVVANKKMVVQNALRDRTFLNSGVTAVVKPQDSVHTSVFVPGTAGVVNVAR
jgi:hypothetical protein